MEIAQIVGLGIAVAVMAVTVKQQSKELGMILGICGSVFIFFMILPKFSAVIEVFQTIAEKATPDTSIITTVLKIVGIAYIAEFGAQICQDAGENAIASKIDLAGKTLVMLMSAPILLGLVSLIGRVMP